MKSSFFAKWNRLSKRERFLSALAGCVLALYATYVGIMEWQVKDILNKKSRLVWLDAEYESLQEGNRRQAELKKKLAGLEAELERKKAEGGMDSGVFPRPPVEGLLDELRKTAGAMPLRLVQMDIVSGQASGTGGLQGYARSVAAKKVIPDTAGVEEGTDGASYSVSKIALSYQSGYRDSVDYILKVIGLPYALSVKSVEMARTGDGGALKSSAKTKGEIGLPDGGTLIITRLGLEIYYR